MDKIYLNKMEFYGFHGLFPEENKLGQRFYVDLVLETDLKQASISDKMSDSIDYGQIFQVTKEIVEGRPRNLVEAVAGDIAEKLLETFKQINGCWIKVYKPDPPIAGHYQSVAVEIYREREDHHE
ncbi:dihydroneopterin aldolase [Aquibacillus sediminis]|uniref:dihydroneopterin aldolase n=1 Tax=Aquibacillus sediminis TaxID=2574734 RepID=UPI0011087A5E|nr:dihydroneopterin aldolase [Aquibacillus sediminis]